MVIFYDFQGQTVNLPEGIILDPPQSNVAIENPQQTTMYKGFSSRPRLISKGYIYMYLLKNELRMNYHPQMLV
jgi:hypothetical protein